MVFVAKKVIVSLQKKLCQMAYAMSHYDFMTSFHSRHWTPLHEGFLSWFYFRESRCQMMHFSYFMSGDGPVPDSASPQSNFDITESLLNFMKTMDEEEELMEAFPNAEIDYTKRVQGGLPIHFSFVLFCFLELAS